MGVFDVACLVWVYWFPPEEEEEEEEEEDADEEAGEPLPPPEGTLWIACDAEQIADDAKPIKGALECPGSVEKRLVLDGSSMGPFHLHTQGGGEGDGPTPCIFSGLTIHILHEDGFAYRAKDPSPLAERCEELGGCELQRLLSCPVVMGFLRPV